MPQVLEHYGRAGKYETITPGDTATGITVGNIVIAAENIKAKAVLITCEDNDVNFTFEGTAPTAKS